MSTLAITPNMRNNMKTCPNYTERVDANTNKMSQLAVSGDTSQITVNEDNHSPLGRRKVSTGSAFSQRHRSRPANLYISSTPKHQMMNDGFNATFDPYQLFEVEQKACLLLYVNVLCARNVSKGWAYDLIDTPDPYVVLTIKTAPAGRKCTSTIDNNANPVWNESFLFLHDPHVSFNLGITLMEANYTVDQEIDTITIKSSSLPKNKFEKRTVYFNEVIELDIELKTELNQKPDLRYGLCLSDDEKDYLTNRKCRVYEALNNLLEDDAPQNLEEVPNIAVIGSGGGFRAMVGFSGVLNALQKSKILDSVTYLGGLSGSSWYISSLYSHKKWPESPIENLHEELRKNIEPSLLWLLKPNSMYRYIDRIMLKKRTGQPVSFTDFFGLLVGETLLKGRQKSKLSDQQMKVRGGNIPLPIYTCVHVKNDVSAKSFQEWIEFTPYEIGIPKYGTYMKVEHFGSKFFMGKMCREHPEPPLHYLQGIWGSAFCILFKRLLEDKSRKDPVGMIRHDIQMELDKQQLDTNSDSSDDEEEIKQEETLKRRSVVMQHHLSSRKSNEGIPKNSVETGINALNNIDPNDISVRRGSNEGDASSKDGSDSEKKASGSEGFWTQMLRGLLENKNWEVLSTRAGRAGVVHNPMRGLFLNKSYPLSPFTPSIVDDKTDEFDGNFEMANTKEKRLYMVDAGLTFNSPFPLILRPQRGVKLILSFDFSARDSDVAEPFKELLLAEKWARINNLPFPPIDTSVFEKEGMKELYIFRHPDDPYCPVIMHFVLCNLKFRDFKEPGVPRETKEEKEFADFNIYDDPDTPYSTFNFSYSNLAFDRLTKLTEFNTLLHIDDIKECIAQQVELNRFLPKKVPIQFKNVKRLPIKSVDNQNKLKQYIQQMKRSNTARTVELEKKYSKQSVNGTNQTQTIQHLTRGQRSMKLSINLPMREINRASCKSVYFDSRESLSDTSDSSDEEYSSPL
ncbi:cytosolic phospholipase A2-like isoform X2 [Octopus sinensis]|uniref:Phospholipase A2 n=1 Tax=Octopus sinensis TaxID=2607531 RepID=A0A6P7S7C6_9MOLL|nr:cytosolic phospholipase A2-like isoform X2 [Octopus sinensis]